MNDLKIIATIGTEFLLENSFCSIENLVKLGINHFRINLSKYETSSELFHIHVILLNLRKAFGDSISILVDLPLPYTKTRIYHSEGIDFIKVRQNNSIEISSCFEKQPCHDLFYINIEGKKIGAEVKINQHITYADGECEFIITSISEDKETIRLCATNDYTIFSRKALNVGVFLENSKKTLYYLNAIKDIDPDGIILSFVSNDQYLNYLHKLMKSSNINCPIISKIESLEGVKNIEAISKFSDIMIARGDLSLNVDVKDFFNIEVKLSEMALQQKHGLYVATDILTSLITSSTPSPSEIVDLTTISYLKPTAIILNFGLVRSQNLFIALNIIKQIFINSP